MSKISAKDALEALRAGGRISPETEEMCPLDTPEPMDAGVAGSQTCSPCGGKGGFAGGLKCRTCNGEGQHSLTLPAKWVYIARRKGAH